MEEKDYMVKRYLNEKAAEEYTSLKRSAMRRWGQKIGAIRHIGGRVVYDRMIMDKAIAETAE